MKGSAPGRTHFQKEVKSNSEMLLFSLFQRVFHVSEEPRD